MTLKTQVAHGLKWQAITIIGRQLLSLIVFTTLARLLEPAAFGLVGLVGVYMVFVGMFVDQGIGVALIQRQELQAEHLDAAFWFNLACATVLCLGTVVCAGPVSKMFGDMRLAPLLRWSSLGMVIGACQEIHATLFMKAMDFRQTAIRTLLANVAGGVVGVAMALAGCGVWALIGQQLGSGIAGACFLWSVSTYRPSMRLSFRHLRELLHVSSSVFFTSFLWFFTSRLDQIVIGRFAGVPALGLYTIAGKIPDFAKTAAQQPVADVSFPAITQLQDNHVRMNEVTYKGMQSNALVSFAVFVGIAAVASDLVPFLFGIKWSAAGSLCSLLSIYALLTGMQIFFRPLLLAAGGMRQWIMLNAFQAIGVLLACIVGIRFGVPYLVLGLIANSLIINIPTLLFLKKRVGLSPSKYCMPCLIPAAASIFMVVIIWASVFVLPSNLTPVFRLSCKIAFGAAAYLAFVWLFLPAALKNVVVMVSHALKSSKKSPIQA